MVRRPPSDAFRALGEILKLDPSFDKVRKLAADQEVVDRFFQVFPHLAGNAVPVKVAKQTLTISVGNSVLRSELKFHETEIIKKINDFFAEPRVAKIKFQA